jgi:hypothetical protein
MEEWQMADVEMAGFCATLRLNFIKSAENFLAKPHVSGE